MAWRDNNRDTTRPAGAIGFYLVAVISMVVSVDTSWRYFAHNLHITDTRERVVMFAVLEVALIACGYGMRANVRHMAGRAHPGWWRGCCAGWPVTWPGSCPVSRKASPG